MVKHGVVIIRAGLGSSPLCLEPCALLSSGGAFARSTKESKSREGTVQAAQARAPAAAAGGLRFAP